MRPSVDELDAFVQVVEAGTITAAARRMGVAKSVLSERLSALESRLGVTLLRRTTRSMALTDAGTGLYDSARDILARLEAAGVHAAAHGGQGGLHGALRLAAPLSFGASHLGELLMPFLQANPGLSCQIELDDRTVDLIDGRFDLAIRIGRLPDSRLVARRLGQTRRVVCASPGYLAQYGVPRTPEDVRHHDTVGYSHTTAARLWSFIDAQGREVTAAVARPRVVANNGDLIREAAIAGLGLVVLPHFIVAAALRQGTLVEVLADAVPAPEPIHAVYLPERQLPPKTRALIDHLIAAFAGRDW